MLAGRRLNRMSARGQTIVEFALVLPIFLLIVFGIFDFGRIVFLQSQLENAVREGVRTGIGMTANNKTPAQIASAVRDRVRSQTGLAGASVAQSCSPASCAYGASITVSGSLTTSFVASGLLPGISPPTLSAAASGRIE